MAIIGVGYSKDTVVNSNLSCPNCNSHQSILITYKQQYFHLFWIPTFPIKKQSTLSCVKCGTGFTEKEITIPLELRRSFKTPKWVFTGLVVITILSSYLIYDIEKDKSLNYAHLLEAIEEPHINQIYEIQIDKEEYTLLKVIAFTPDSIFFTTHTLVTNLPSGLKEPDKNNFSSDEGSLFGLSKEDIRLAIEQKVFLKAN